MNRTPKWINFLLALVLSANGTFYIAFADQDHQGEKSRHQERKRNQSEHSGKGNLTIVSNPMYGKNCGACHFAYQPALLPSGSWDRILSSLSDHFGEAIELDTESKKVISEFLRSKAADVYSTEVGDKIMRSLGNQTPLRITEIPYILKKHREIQPNVFKRESIHSLSNCSACHTTAEKGIYDDDNVAIPR